MKSLPSLLRLGAAGQTKKLHVKVKSMKLEGICAAKMEEYHGKERTVVVVEMVWKGPKSIKLFKPFHTSTLKRQRNFSSHKFLKKGEAIEWDEEFDNICHFLIASKKNNNSFSSWEVKFKVLYGEDAKCKTKLMKMGYVDLNIAELTWREDSEIEQKLPLSLQIDGVATQATLSIRVSFAEIRNSIDSPQIFGNSPHSDNKQVISKTARSLPFSTKKMKIHKEDPCNSNQSTQCNSNDPPKNEFIYRNTKSGSCHTSLTRFNSGLKLFSWRKKKGWSFKLSRKKREQPTEKDECCTIGRWSERELVSRDGETKLKARVFFASFDQRSKTAMGESACAALVAVIAHWLQANQDFMPTTSEFDSLIKQGCSEWRKLCSDEAYRNCFPNNHFDIDTILKADLRPLNVCNRKSFTGIFNPEKFEHLKGAKSFDDVWEEISSITEDCVQRIYIVSWNDHFFVLKADVDVYYIIDSLGERLFEGCNQAYILKFDDSTVMYCKANEEEGEDIICKGKECCREFIKRFLAAIPVRELEEEEKKGTVSTSYLLKRLQIDFHYCSSSSASPNSSPFPNEWPNVAEMRACSS